MEGELHPGHRCVSSLYTIISQQHDREAVEHYLETDDLLPSQRDFILALLDFAMGRNYFWFDGTYYLQNRGVAMGAKFAQSMSNLFMAKLEEDVTYVRL